MTLDLCIELNIWILYGWYKLLREFFCNLYVHKFIPEIFYSYEFLYFKNLGNRSLLEKIDSVGGPCYSFIQNTSVNYVFFIEKLYNYFCLIINF